MKAKIKYSRFVTVLTATIFAAMFISLIVTIHEKPAFFTLLPIYLIMIGSALLYGVAYIKIDKENIILGSILRSKKVALRNVNSVELYQPTMGATRIFASGGFMGYWGIFREGDTGRYYAFYGKASDCFLVRMKNGDKYVLGCDNPNDMVSYIRSQIRSDC